MRDDEIRAAVSGDLKAVGRLGPDSFGPRPPCPGELVLTADVVREVLRVLCSGEASAEDVQRWASFMRRGYVSSSDAPESLQTLDIEYEQPHEDAIVEVISRMDELGDEVDGHITVEETVRLEGLLNDR